MYLTLKQEAAFDRGKWLLARYPEISPEHAAPGIQATAIAGDMVADILFAMSSVYDYDEDDIRSIAIVALNALRDDQGLLSRDNKRENT